MPTVKRTSNGNGAPVADVTPEEAAVIRSSVGAKEQAPTTRVQAVFSNWKEVADQLGSPFEVEKIPISKLRAMRRDPMLGFGLSFIKNPHVRARWFIDAKDKKGPNAQIAAHLDQDLRRVYASYVMQYFNSLDFGFQAIAKRFEFRTPSGTFIDVNNKTGDAKEKPIWSSGSVQPIAWKPFVALKPEGVEPQWNNDGEFDGIKYAPTASTGGTAAPAGVGATGTGGGSGGSNQEQEYKIDLAHSLWVTNERDQVFGSIFGYPRLGYAYRYWWSYWFRWAIADRAFERKADPSVIVRYPEGAFIDETTGSELSYQDYALEMGSRMRSGGVIALPSQPYEDANGRGTIREWDIEFTKDAVNFEPFDKSFEYLDVQKLRSLFIPEQAFLEGKGGTSSRNVAAEMGDSFLESQAVLSAALADNINRFLIPQWLAVNYPEFLANGGEAKIVIQGFAQEDVEFMRQLVQLVGQQETGASEILKLVDIKKVLEDRGAPISSYQEQQRRQQELVTQQQQNSQPAATPGIPGQQVGVVPTSTGFSYVQPREVIYLSDASSKYVTSLPNSVHFEDPEIRRQTQLLWDQRKNHVEKAIEIYASAIESGTEPDTVAINELHLSDTIETFRKIGELAFANEAKRAGLPAPDAGVTDKWATESAAQLCDQIDAALRREHQCFVDARDGDTEDHDAAFAFKTKYSEYPVITADSVTREVVNVYNAATIELARTNGVKRVQARCDSVELDGKLFPADESLFALSLSERSSEPNISWRLVQNDLKIEERSDVEFGASWDDEAKILTLSNQLDPAVSRTILKDVVDKAETVLT